MIIQTLLLLLIATAHGGLGLLAFYRQPNKPDNQLFALYTASIGLWPLALAMFMLDNYYGGALFWAQLSAIVVPGFLLVFLLFLHVFSAEREEFSYGRQLLLTLPLSLMMLALAIDPSWLITGLSMTVGHKHVLLSDNGLRIYSGLFLLYAVAALLALYRHSRLKTGVLRLHLRYLLFGILTLLGLGVTLDLVLLAAGWQGYVWLGPVLTVPYIILIAIAMLRHQMLDVRLVIARSLAYLFAMGMLLVVYSTVAFLLAQQLVNSTLTVRQQIFYASLAVMLAVLFPAAKRYFDHLTNRLFYRRDYNFQTAVDAVSRILVNEVDLDQLADQTRHIISNTVKPKFTVFALLDSEPRTIGTTKHKLDLDAQLLKALQNYNEPMAVAGQVDRHEALSNLMQAQDIAIVLRLVDQSKPLGYVFLGHPKTGGLYTSQDFKFLKILTRELILSVQNARRFDEIQELNATLQQRIDAATHELRQSNSRLKELDQAKDEFISMASHQLRTPLTSIKGYVSMVMEGDAGKITKHQHELLESAFDSSQRMVYLIADLLNASRLQTGKFVIEPREIDLRDILATEIKQITETAKARGLTLTYKQADKFPIVMLDENKIHQVIMNFIDNAIYYTPTGGKIAVELTATPTAIEFKVTDNGIGVPKDEQHKLFTKFYRAGNARKARPDGTGLGLFMAQKIVVEQKGAIIFNSVEGKGSVFGFTFPLKAVEVKAGLKNPTDQAKEQQADNGDQPKLSAKP